VLRRVVLKLLVEGRLRPYSRWYPPSTSGGILSWRRTRASSCTNSTGGSRP